jgi:hypothetical protein
MRKWLLLVTFLLPSACFLPSEGQAAPALVEGNGFPICRRMVEVLRQMPSSVRQSTWPERLPAIPGVTWPHWSALNPADHMETIRAFMIQKVVQSSHDRRDPETIWAEVGPKVESAIRAGRFWLEETDVHQAMIGLPYLPAQKRSWKTDMHFVRVGQLEKEHWTIGGVRAASGNSLVKVWSFMVASFGAFPSVHNDLVDDGIGGLQLFLVGRQPWFISSGGTVSEPYTTDLELSNNLVTHRISLDQRCLISFQ